MSQTDHYVRDDVRAFLDFLKSQDGPQIYELPLDEARAAPRAMGELADAPARELAVVRDLTCPGPAGTDWNSTSPSVVLIEVMTLGMTP